MRKPFWLPALRCEHAVVKSYQLFALADGGRVDRGFQARFLTHDDAIAFACTIQDATAVEVLFGGEMIAKILFGDGNPKVLRNP